MALSDKLTFPLAPMIITVVTAMFTISQTEAEVGAQVATLGWSQESGVVSFESPFHVPVVTRKFFR